MKILVTGSNGLLGQKIIYALKLKSDLSVIATSKGRNRMEDSTGYIYEELDITDETAVVQIVKRYKPDCIINTAAMTNVDACELERAQCRNINVNAVSHFVKACSAHSIHLIHLSTDFVFDGESGPYKEDDSPNPLSYYAQCKLESEEIIRQSTISWAVIRTIIIYGVVDDVQRSNIVLWVKNSLEQGKAIKVITDQFRSPTLAEDLAEACITAAMTRSKGIFHVSGKELMSILDIAFFVADFFGLDKSLIVPVSTEALNQQAKRPLRTGFIIDKARQELGYQPHSLQQGLAIVAAQLKAKRH